MLRYLRENTGNWIIKFFLGIIVIVFVFLGIGSMKSNRNDTVATINDEPISIKEFQSAYRNTVEQMRQRFGDNLNQELLDALNVKQQALDNLIQEKLIAAEAEKLKVRVTDQELQDSLLSVKAFQRNGSFDIALYQKVLGMNSMTPESFEILQRNSLMQQKVRDLVLSSITVSDVEAKEWYVFQNTQVAVDYILTRPESFTEVQPTEEEIRNQYTGNPHLYQSEPKLKAVYIKFSPEDHQGEVEVSENQIQEFYNQNPDRFKIPEKVETRHILIKVAENADEKAVESARVRAEEIRSKAENGEDFSKLAKTFSEGPSKTSGGYLGSFARGSMVKPFEDAAFSLKAGEISQPVRTQFGWHLIKVEAHFDATVKTLAEASEEIRKELANQEMTNMAYYQAGEAFDSVVDGDDLEQVALIAKKKIMETKAFTQSGQGLDLVRRAEFAKAAFELPLNEISDVQQMGDDYYIIRVTEKIEPELLSFEEVKSRIELELKSKLQNEAAKAAAEALVEKAKTASTLEQVAKENNVKLESTPLFKRNEQIQEIGNSQELTKIAFGLGKDKPIHPEVLETSKGFAVIGFKEKQKPSSEDMAGHLKETRDQLAWMKQGQYFQAWIDDLKTRNEIEIDETFLN
ncbi:peptidylprolyl isomerase [Desulfospira joergensenii]|uniref:peptidylprolyl isomerase n=1 Tax=Desulfospira joergensenii TaxID=53329 RepID=UPI0003B7499A|nr:peptidylprolyl isomerase [Desulfospira joergensenii]